MSVIGLKTKNGVNYSGLSSYDDTELRTLINGKVSKQTGKSLIADSQITRLANVDNYDDSQIVSSLSSKVTAVSGQSLISISQINRLAEVQNYDDTQLRGIISNKVDAQAGKSLISTSEITRLANVSNYNDAALRSLIDQKVTAVDGYSMVSDDQIQRLSNISNYDDSELRQAISSGSANITQAILSCEIPQDQNVQFLDVTIKLCPNPDMQTGLIQINNMTHHSIMHIALDSQFVPLSDYYYEDEQGSPKIPFSYFTGTLTVRLSAETVEGFNPNIPWYAVAIWSNGIVSSDSKMIQFLHSGFCEMPRVTTSTTSTTTA